jgi:hypothetical protein
MNTSTQRNGVIARAVDATLVAPVGLFQNNVIDDIRNDNGKVHEELLRRWLTGRTAGPRDLALSLALARAAAPSRGRDRVGPHWFHATRGRSTHPAAGWHCGT